MSLRMPVAYFAQNLLHFAKFFLAGNWPIGVPLSAPVLELWYGALFIRVLSIFVKCSVSKIFLPLNNNK